MVVMSVAGELQVQAQAARQGLPITVPGDGESHAFVRTESDSTGGRLRLGMYMMIVQQHSAVMLPS
jgi:hypothetical protein